MFWVALGAGAGVLAVRKLQKTARAYSPAGLADRAGGVGDSLRYFADEVRAGMAQRESELRDALGIDAPGADASPDGSTGKPSALRRSSG